MACIGAQTEFVESLFSGCDFERLCTSIVKLVQRQRAMCVVSPVYLAACFLGGTCSSSTVTVHVALDCYFFPIVDFATWL